MAIQQVSVSVATAGTNAPTEFRAMERYEISIPNPGGAPVRITAYHPADASVDGTGSYRDGNIQTARNHDFMWHSITDASGNSVRVLMRDSDWERYQSALSDFAAAAASNPNIYKTNSASLAGGLFTPQVQAGGGGASAPRPFHPLTTQQLQRMGVQTGSEYVGSNDSAVDITLYDPGTNATARAALVNAGYVEVIIDGAAQFLSPADAAIHNG